MLQVSIDDRLKWTCHQLYVLQVYSDERFKWNLSNIAYVCVRVCMHMHARVQTCTHMCIN